MMATSYKVQLSADSTPGHTHVPGLKNDSADQVSELLMLNHEKYHTLFSDVGLHNHIVHHLLSLWALGATPSEIKAAYDLNKGFQIPRAPLTVQSSSELHDPAVFQKRLGKSKYYTDYLHFFQNEIAKHGVEEIVKEYVFKGDVRADDIMARMYSGFEHPILHLGFGLEFAQPCIVAEALASACIHDNSPLAILLAVEKHVQTNPDIPQKSLLSVASSLRSDPKISTAVKSTDPPDRLNYGLLKRVTGADLAPHFSSWIVTPTPSSVSYKSAEMISTCTYITGSAQHPLKAPSMDFFLMHSTNLSVFYPVFASLPWLTLQQKARLLNWKGWMDMLLYAASGCPALCPERISTYTPKHPGDWDSVIQRATRYPDDGHTSKLIRAILNAEHISEPYLGGKDFPLKREDFLNIAHMTMDSVEIMLKPGYKIPIRIEELYVGRLGVDREVAKIVARFVRWCGVEGAWDDFPDRQDGDGVGNGCGEKEKEEGARRKAML